jgi:hypothetical protein
MPGIFVVPLQRRPLRARELMATRNLRHRPTYWRLIRSYEELANFVCII